MMRSSGSVPPEGLTSSAVVAFARVLLAHGAHASRPYLKERSPDIDALIKRQLRISREHPEPPARARAADIPELEPLRRLLVPIEPASIAPDILALLLAVELDPDSRTYSQYMRDALGSALTIDSLTHALGIPHAEAITTVLAPGAPLRRHRLVEVREDRNDLHALANVRASQRMVRWVLRPGDADDELGRFCRLLRPSPTPELSPAALAAVEPIVEEVRSFLERQRGRHASSDLVLRGPRGTGRSEIAREACRRLGVPALVVPLAQVAAHPSPGEAIAAALREEVLLDAQLVLENGELLSVADDTAQKLRSALSASTRPLLVTSSSSEAPHLWTGRRLVARDVDIVPSHEREAIWREALPEINASETASLYRVGVGSIARIAVTARLVAELRPDGKVTRSDLAAAVRGEFETDLGTVATHVKVSQRWEDLVVPEDTGRTISELVDQLHHRAIVLGGWGFQRKLGKGVGTVALFTGEPGTGKSMVAGLIAKTLELDLYQVDLSRVLSKWIGETEKNLAKVFDAAETGHVVLLFDEADALLSKRTVDIKSSTDRYSNIETNYILQRLEAFHGVAILTSNMETGIDPALSRRLSFELKFPFPDVEHRAEIWRRMLPAELPIAGEIDFRALAERFEIAGGHIRNIVLRAAFLAAAERRPAAERALGMQHLLTAAEYEYRDHGMLVARGRLPK